MEGTLLMRKNWEKYSISSDDLKESRLQEQLESGHKPLIGTDENLKATEQPAIAPERRSDNGPGSEDLSIQSRILIGLMVLAVVMCTVFTILAAIGAK